MAYTLDEVGESDLNVPSGQLKESLWVRQVTGGETQVVPPADVRYGGLTFSRDGDFLYFVQAGAKDPAFSSLYKIPVLGGMAQLLVPDVDGLSPVSLSPDGKHLALVRESTEKNESVLMVANEDGSGQRRLAVRKLPATFGLAAWSPDGKTIAAIGHDFQRGVAYSSPVEVPVRGGPERPVTAKRWFWIWGLAWLSDGQGLIVNTQEQNSGPSQMAYVSRQTGEIHRITSDLNHYVGVGLTSDSRTLATVQVEDFTDVWVTSLADPSNAKPVTSGGRSFFPAWTPDGRITYEKFLGNGDSIWIMGARGDNPRELASNTGGKDYHLQVSPDGRYIVFISERSGTPHVWRMDIDGNNPKQLTNSPYDAFDLPACSPDGRWVLYTKEGREKGVWRVSIDGGDPVQLNGVEATSPVVSPDGKTIAYFYRYPSGTPPQGIAIMVFEGGQPLRQFEMPHQFRRLRWAPDGRSLLYIKGQRGISNLWSQPIAGGPPRQVTHFNTDQIFTFDLSRDGKRLVLSRGRTTRDVVLIRDVR